MLLVLIPLGAQDAPPPQKKGAPSPPKNLKILKADGNLIPTMRSFTAALGVECQYCHVRGDFASDDNPKKTVARMMIGMAQDINAKFPPVEGKMYVTCYTCHRGKNMPETTPPTAPPGGGR